MGRDKERGIYSASPCQTDRLSTSKRLCHLLSGARLCRRPVAASGFNLRQTYITLTAKWFALSWGITSRDLCRRSLPAEREARISYGKPTRGGLGLARRVSDHQLWGN